MADSKRLQILKALTSQLEATPGYVLTDKVWRGRTRPADESEAPFICLFEMPPKFQEQADRQLASMPWYIGVQGYLAPSYPHPTDTAHDLMAAVKSQLGKVLDDGGAGPVPEGFMLQGLIQHMQVDGGMCFEPDDTTNCCFFAMQLTITVAESLGDPYA